MTGGRQKNSIWRYLEEKKSFGKSGSRATCSKCNKEMQGLVQRLNQHYRICSAPPSEPPKEELDDDSASAYNSSSTTNISSTGFDSDNSLKISPVIQTMRKFICTTSETQQNEIDIILTEVVAACNLPFRMVDHTLFIKFCAALRPSYKPPNRKRLSSQLIPLVYEQNLNENKKSLKNEPVCLAIDGWQNARLEPIICSTITRDSGESFLVSTVDTTGMEHTGEHLKDIGTIYMNGNNLK